MDAMEDTHQVLGDISTKLVLLLDGSTKHKTGANPTHLLHVITTQLENMNHVVPQSQHQPVKRPVLQDTQDHMLMIDGKLHQFIQFHQLLAKSKLKS